MKISQLFEKEQFSDIIKEIEKYNNDGYYISFTNIDKIGINPKSKYNTPIGIYSYPVIDEIYDNIKSKQSFSKGTPFAGDAKYIWLFSPKNKENGLYLGKNYTGDDYYNDLEKLEDYMTDVLGLHSSAFNILKQQAEKTSKRNSVSGYIWNFTRLLANYLSEKRKIIKGGENLTDNKGNALDLGIPVKTLYNTSSRAGIITDIIETDGVIVTFKYDEYYSSTNFDFDEIEVIDNELYNNYISFMNNRKFFVDDLVSLKGRRYRIDNVDFFKNSIFLVDVLNYDSVEMTFEEFYEENPELSHYDIKESVLIKNYDEIANTNSILWTYILNRVLGYEFAADLEGTGLIHDNEPVQAVFFNKKVISVENKYINPNFHINDEDPFIRATSPKELNKYPRGFIYSWLNRYANNKKSISDKGVEWRKSIEVNNIKLQAKLIMSNVSWIYFIKNVSDEAIRILDKKMIKYIKNLDKPFHKRSAKMQRIWEYFSSVHKNDWTEGEKAILQKALSDERFHKMIFDFIYMVKRREGNWPYAEKVIMQQPNLELKLIYAVEILEISSKLNMNMKEMLDNLYEKYRDDKNIQMIIVDIMHSYEEKFGKGLFNQLK